MNELTQIAADIFHGLDPIKSLESLNNHTLQKIREQQMEDDMMDDDDDNECSQYSDIVD